MNMKFIVVGILFALLSLPVQANVWNATLWKPQYTSEVFQAPAPSDVTAREEAFRNRNSGESLKQLTEQFAKMLDFGLVPPAVKEKYLKGDYQGVLDAYRDFFIDRLRFPPPGYPYGYSFGPQQYELMRAPWDPAVRALLYLASADELMSNTVVFAMKDKEEKLVSLRINVGPPGRVNWNWQPEDYINAGRMTVPRKAGMLNNVMGEITFCNALLVEYIKTKDPRYLKKWCDFMDDSCLNWKKSAIASGRKVRINWNGVGNYTENLWLNLAYVSRMVPNFEQDLSSATLARLIIDMFETWMPPALRGARTMMGNRRLGMYGNHLFWGWQAFPEFRTGQYCMREWRRMMESHAAVASFPDFTDPGEMARQYLFSFSVYGASGWRFLNNRWLNLGNAPYWLNAEWTQEFLDYLEPRGRYMIHQLNNAGYSQMIGDYLSPPYSMVLDFCRYLLPLVPKVMTEPDCAKILTALYGGQLPWYKKADPRQGQPSFSSEALPYAGYYAMRTGYGREEHHLFTYSCIAPWTGGDWWGSEASITLQAFGRDLLKSYSGTTLIVDEALCAVDPAGVYRAMHPEVHVKWWEKLNFKKAPLKHRWHTSDQFDLCETTYDFPFNNIAFDSKGKPLIDNLLWIEDVIHRRQIIFVRQSGLYVVTDRMISTNSHKYAIRWGFAGATEKVPPWLLNGSYGYTNYGFTTSQIMVDTNRNAFRTTAPSTANLSIYHFSPQPLKVSLFGPMQGRCDLKGSGNQILTSILYPRRTLEDDLRSIEALPPKEGITGWKAILPDGTRLSYYGAVNEAALKLDDVEIKGQALLLKTSREGKRSGIALGCSEFKVGWRKAAIPCADFEFTLSPSKPSAFSLLSSVISRQSSAISFTPIYRPLDLVEISPEADCFVEQVEVTMSHPEPDVDIRYTLDGTDPTGASALYQKPINLNRTAVVKARAFRKGVTEVPPTFSGTHVSAVTRANYTRDEFWPAKRVVVTNGFGADYYESDFTLSMFTTWNTLKPVKSAAVPGLFDLSLKRPTQGNYAFIYSGYLDVPRDGVYNFHAPPEFIYPAWDSGYDLRVFLDDQEWYPATRLHNYGTWSVPLQKGKHRFVVYWVDQRPGQAQWAYPDKSGVAPAEGEENRDEKYMIWNGDKPKLEISGPGIAKQPIPDSMLYR